MAKKKVQVQVTIYYSVTKEIEVESNFKKGTKDFIFDVCDKAKEIAESMPLDLENLLRDDVTAEIIEE